jgi:hypothetical protein
MSYFTAIELRGVLKSYHECPEGVLASDWDFFRRHPQLSHLVRVPFKDELENPDDNEAYLSIVRRHTYDTLGRRLFIMSQDTVLRFDERVARMLWVAWEQYLFCGKTELFILAALSAGLQDLKRFPTVGPRSEGEGRYTPQLGCIHIEEVRHLSSDMLWRLRWRKLP